jgi:hypothetical protein
MAAIIQQPTGALFIKREADGNVCVTVREHRTDARIRLTQEELHHLYCELAVTLVEGRPRGG